MSALRSVLVSLRRLAGPFSFPPPLSCNTWKPGFQVSASSPPPCKVCMAACVRSGTRRAADILHALESLVGDLPRCVSRVESVAVFKKDADEPFSFCHLQSAYAQLLAANTLTKLVSRPNITLPLEQRVDMRKSPDCRNQRIEQGSDSRVRMFFRGKSQES